MTKRELEKKKQDLKRRIVENPSSNLMSELAALDFVIPTPDFSWSDNSDGGSCGGDCGCSCGD